MAQNKRSYFRQILAQITAVSLSQYLAKATSNLGQIFAEITALIVVWANISPE